MKTDSGLRVMGHEIHSEEDMEFRTERKPAQQSGWEEATEETKWGRGREPFY